MANEALERLKDIERRDDNLIAIATPADGRIEALPRGAPGEYFRFVLDAVAVNDNGVSLTRAEAQKAARTAVGAKIKMATKPIEKEGDLHERSFTSKVGKIVEAELKGDEIVCVGRISDTTEHSRLCRESLTDKDIGYVSKENSFIEGECSACGKRFKAGADACKHLRYNKKLDMVFGHKGAHVIMHGVRYKGVALLDKPGALKTARILEVAATKLEENMDKDTKTTEEREMETQASKVGDLENELAETKALLKEVSAERDELKTKNETFSAKEKERASKDLVALMKAKGRTFADDKAEAAEVEKLTALSEDAFNAKKESYEEMPEPKAEAKGEGDASKTDAKKSEGGQETKATTDGPADVSDRGEGDEKDIKNLCRKAVHG